MDASPSDCGMRVRESTAFAHVCHLHGFRPEQFQISVTESLDCDGSNVALERVFVITQLSSGCQRSYRADHFSGGLEAFERDLRAGVFPWGSVDWDWISAHRYS